MNLVPVKKKALAPQHAYSKLKYGEHKASIEADYKTYVPPDGAPKPTLFAYRNQRMKELYEAETDPEVLAAVQARIKAHSNDGGSPEPTFEDEAAVSASELERRRKAWRYQE